MCFVLYVASKKTVPVIPWNDEQRALWTTGLTAHDQTMRHQFKLSEVAYVGSDNQCGCGFRHATYQQGEWPEEWEANAPDYDPSDTQPNHLALAAFLRSHCAGEPFVELFGVWDGDYAKTPKGHLEVQLERLADPKFFFRERVHYRVTGLPTASPPNRRAARTNH